MNKKVLTLVIVSTIILCIIISFVFIISALFLIRPSETLVTGDPVSTPIQDVIRPTKETQPEMIEEGSNEDLPEEVQSEIEENGDDEDIPRQVQAEMDLIQRQVIDERGLKPIGDFTRDLLTREQLNQRLIEDFEEDYNPEEERESAIILELFGLLNAEFDLYNFYLELLTEQVAGFYDNETKEMVVILGEGFEAPQKLTYAHEYTHALQDFNFDIQDGLNYNDDSCETDTERCAAIQALLEGDATLSELTWFQKNATIEDQQDILSFYDDLESPILDSAPSFLVEDLLFPYEFGYSFVNNLYQIGGWDSVDLAYTSPPVTTEQILHPEKYPDDQPIDVYIPDLTPELGTGWKEIDRNVMGEWYIYLILGHGLSEQYRITETKAKNAAEGWGGDSYVVYLNDESESAIMVFRTQWESASQADEYIDVFKEYARKRFGKPTNETAESISWELPGETHAFFMEEEFTTWLYAPNPELINKLWNIIQNED